ncbi:MAG: hypothetical protein AABX93_00680 [Nanoarchaeota archaeon]
MENLIEKVKFIVLEKTEETISIESLRNSECVYHYPDPDISGRKNEFKGKLSKIEFVKENSPEVFLYIISTERPDKGTKTITGKMGILGGNLVAYVTETKIN